MEGGGGGSQEKWRKIDVSCGQNRYMWWAYLTAPNETSKLACFIADSFPGTLGTSWLHSNRITFERRLGLFLPVFLGASVNASPFF